MAKTKNRWAIISKKYLTVLGDTSASRIPVRGPEWAPALRTFHTRDAAREYRAGLKIPTNYYVVDRDNLIAVR